MQVFSASRDNSEQLPALCEQSICVLLARNSSHLEMTREPFTHLGASSWMTSLEADPRRHQRRLPAVFCAHGQIQSYSDRERQLDMPPQTAEGNGANGQRDKIQGDLLSHVQ
jgi:hypothetical protein